MKTILPIVTLLTLAVSAKADYLIIPNAPTGNVVPNAGSSYASLVGGVGLSAPITTGENAATALTLTSDNNISNEYVTGASGASYFTAGTIPVLTFALGSTYNNVDSVLVWNYLTGTTGTNGAQTFSLTFFSDAAATVQIGSTLTGLSLTQATGTTGSAQQISFANVNGVQAIQMTLTSNYNGNRVGLAEVDFAQSISAVPEPSSAALLGFGGLGLILFLRFRRNKEAAVSRF